MAFKLAVILGSVREKSNTRLAMDITIDEVKRLDCELDLIDPTGIQTESLGKPFADDIREDLQNRIRQADGIIMCTPEYNGCFSYVLMAVIENLGYPSALDGKPISMLGVASGRIGAVKSLEHLRLVCGHLGAIVLPWPISIEEIHKKISPTSVDEKTEELIRSVPKGMVEYLKKFS